jgi:hypothetical protein
LIFQEVPNKQDQTLKPPYNNPSQLQSEIQTQFKNLIAIVFSCSILLFLLIWVLILRFTQKITYPIKQLTHLTEMIKQATGKESREHVLNAIETHDIFEKTKKQIMQQDAHANANRNGAAKRRQTVGKKDNTGGNNNLDQTLNKSGTMQSSDYTQNMRRTLLDKGRRKNRRKTIS